MTKTLIEFYDNDNRDNIMPLLFDRYGKVIFVSFEDNAPDDKSSDLLDSLIKEKFGADTVFLTAEEKSLPFAYRLLYEITGKDDEFVIDLTGGSGLFAAAAGILISTESRQNVSAVVCGTNNCRLYEQYPERGVKDPVVTLDVNDLIRFSGGAVISASKTYTEMNGSPALRTEITRMWDTVKSVTADWNRFCSMTNRREGGFVTKKLSRADDKKTCERLTGLLKRRGIIKNDRMYTSENGKTYLEYELCPKAKTIEMYEKSGTALELYSCLAAGESGSFTDAASGVLLDLDGLITKKKGDPRNEIDLAAVYKNRLVLMSCKCTKPTKEHLYEVLTMAEQYGGKYAIPALICSEPAFEPVRERAAEMGVILIDNVLNSSLKTIKEKFRTLFPV